jgi:F-type H+-transporting ATPase subunit alpha
MSLEHQVIEIFAGTQGFADKVPLDRMRDWEVELLRYMDASHPDIGKDISQKKRITPETEAALREALKTFSSTWG